MKWLQENSFTAMVGAVTLAFLIVLFVTDEKIEKYEHIHVVEGDTLWSLADHYRGKMSKDQWIAAVKADNIIYDNQIKAGQVISVPVEKKSAYIAQQNLLEKDETVKVASDF